MRTYMTVQSLVITFLLTLLANSVCFATAPLQTQFGPDGVEVDVMKVKSNDKNLIVVFKFRSTGGRELDFESDHRLISFLDDTETKKYHVLRDSKGEFLTSNYPENVFLKVKGGRDGSVIVWYKFPLPPDSVKKITLYIPDFSPFDPVEISR